MTKKTLIEELREAGAVGDAPVTTEAIPEVSTEIKVEKGIAIPESRGGGGKSKYPWASLGVGDSFFVGGGKIETFYTLCSSASKKHGGKYIVKKWTEKGVEGVRVWKQQ
ncbi:hypothetical protein M2323_004690 [Rhodoblastus acidophilus]|uniref:DUF7303 family protein n=1 Tax=Rhodoblastus acidophilus TaxID=1074 RepID=UPI002225559D|nr:hypothetical protein [Rhodoblastus acidophilus]MCW2286877.1 hypothetical protein [Rhodoblastus acidophilus]MCW2335734.1 hypothetical protein [Rhodoblastus acidophilus]